MIIRKIAVGDASEAFVEDRLSESFNIIYSDDNNKGKTIVMQSSLYSLGNEAIFPSSFNYKDYYHYVEIELDSGKSLCVCRRGNSFIAKCDEDLVLIDSVSELKRYLNRNGLIFPVIIKDGTEKMVDPVLMYQLFFVGQDNKDSSTIFNDSYYKKDDFWNLIYSYAGIDCASSDIEDIDEIKTKIAILNDEKKVILSNNKILKSTSPAVGNALQEKNRNEFEEKLKKINKVRDEIVEVTKQRNRATSRKVINEKTLKEIRSLNRTPDTGTLHCMDCGSQKIGYSSGDKSYTFDISDAGMRNNIIASIEDKIAAYQEEIEATTRKLGELQRKLQELLKDEDISLEAVLVYKNEIVEATDADNRLTEIDSELKSLKAKLKNQKDSTKSDKDKREELKRNIVSTMNDFYKKIDPNGTLVFDDIFSKRNNVFSGCEETEFYLAKLYSIADVLGHTFPIMMDFFRDGELSTEKEEVVLQQFSLLNKQIIFTATLKQEELNKYEEDERINAINYSDNADSHILSEKYVDEFATMLSPLMIDLKE